MLPEPALPRTSRDAVQVQPVAHVTAWIHISSDIGLSCPVVYRQAYSVAIGRSARPAVAIVEKIRTTRSVIGGRQQPKVWHGLSAPYFWLASAVDGSPCQLTMLIAKMTNDAKMAVWCGPERSPDFSRGGGIMDLGTEVSSWGRVAELTCFENIAYQDFRQHLLVTYADAQKHFTTFPGEG